ncbi:MAG: hypothetical protein NT166_04605 [Candidatus Aminicenantes bacterium]|nr:hypothetical protein [Candidatus Aminicenantes bacterium]
MQGIIGTFLGFLISFLVSILLLNQPGAFQKVPDLLKQPIYIVFIIVGTLAGMLVGYFSKAMRFANDNLKKESGKEGEPATTIQFNDSLADTIVTVTGIFYGLIVVLLKSWWHYFFIVPVLLLWFLFRKSVFKGKIFQIGQITTKPAETAEKKPEE